MQIFNADVGYRKSNMIKKLKAVLFDVDDTLFDRNRAQREILHLIVQESIDIFTGIDEETIFDAFLESDRLATQEFNGGGPADVVRNGRSRRFLKILGLSEDIADKITTMYIKSYSTVGAQVRGAKFVIENLVGKFQLGVISNGFPDVQYQKLKTLGVKQLFNCIVLSGEVGLLKPDPRIFWKANTSLAREPEECLFVGDSYNVDVVGAKRAGMRACWFNPHHLRPLQVDIKPDFEIAALDEILQILD